MNNNRRRGAMTRSLRVGAVLAALIADAAPLTAQQPTPQPRRATTAEARTARYFETIRNRPPELILFLRDMPKGADLHNHLSGGIYAETFIQWAAEGAMCV